MHECSPEHLRMGTATMKRNKETEEVDKLRRGEYGKKYNDHEKMKSRPPSCSSRVPSPRVATPLAVDGLPN